MRILYRCGFGTILKSTSPPSPLLEVKRGVPKPGKLVLTTNSKYSVLTTPVSSYWRDNYRVSLFSINYFPLTFI